MNEELKRAVQLLARARAIARARREPMFSPEEEEAFIREETGGKFGRDDISGVMGDIGVGLLQGLTFNFGDELAEAFLGPEAGERVRMIDEQLPPPLVLGTGLAGLALPAVGVGATAARAGSTIGRAVARGAATGAASGALAGAGAAESGDRLQSAAVGGIAGAALGAAVPAAVGGARRYFSPDIRAQATAKDVIEASGGVKALLSRLDEIVRAGRGREVMVADLSPEMQILTERNASMDPRTFITLEDRILARNAAHSERVLEDVRALAGNPVAEQRMRQLVQDRRAWAKSDAGYAGLRERNIALPEPAVFEQFLNQPHVRDIWRRAEELKFIGAPPRFADKASSMRDVFTWEVDPKTGVPVLKKTKAGPPPSFAEIHTTIQKLGDAAEAAFNSTGRSKNGVLGEQLREVQHALTRLLEDQVPEFRAVQNEYRRRLKLEEALRLGGEWFDKEDTRDLLSTLEGLTPEQLQLFREGLASRLISRLRNAKTNRKIANELLAASPAMQEKLHLVFGGPREFDEFMRRMGAERTFARTERAIRGSATAQRTALQNQNLGEALVGAGTEGPVGTAAQRGARSVLRFARRRIREAEARRLAPFLTTQGASAVRDAVIRAAQGPNVVPSLLRGPSQTILGGLLGEALVPKR